MWQINASQLVAEAFYDPLIKHGASRYHNINKGSSIAPNKSHYIVDSLTKVACCHFIAIWPTAAQVLMNLQQHSHSAVLQIE